MNESIEVLEMGKSSVRDLLYKSMAFAEESSDYLVTKANISNCMFNANGGLTYYDAYGEVHHSSMSRWALSQLSTKVGVPCRYIEKCIESGRIDLAQENVNSWLEDYNKDLFIREYQDSIRGILSSKYSVCDTHEILDVVDDRLDLDLYNVKGYFLTPERFHVRLVQKEMMKVPDEDLYAGISIDSSDVGRNILQVRFIVFKKVCTNGLIVSKGASDLFSQKHIGITKDEFAQGFSNSLDLVPQIISSVEDMIIKTMDKKTMKFTKLSEEDLTELISNIRLTTKLSEEGAKKVISIMQSEKYPNNRWGYVNALTEVAQDLTLEKRLELEHYAGTLLVA